MKRTPIGLIALACLMLLGACDRGAQDIVGDTITQTPAPPQQSQPAQQPNGRVTLAPTLLPTSPGNPDDGAIMPSPNPEKPKPTPVVDTAKVALLATMLTSALEDGATPEIPTYIAGDEIPDDFLYATVYFYQFCMDVPENRRTLGPRAVLPQISDGAYQIDEKGLLQIIRSFFGPMESVNLDVFDDHLADDGLYAFALSDGPIPKAEIMLAEWTEDTLIVNVHLTRAESEPAEIGTLVLGLTPDAESLFGYALESFVYMPAYTGTSAS